MNMKLSLILIFVTVSLLGAACTLKGVSDTVLQTSNYGTSWKSKSLVKSQQGKLLRLSSAQATFLVVNPLNSLQLWLGTKDHGLFVSENAGEYWTQVIAGESVVGMALDPTQRCTLYIALEKKVLRTQNCAENWDLVYNETRPTLMSAIALDWADPQNLYITTRAGDVFKSTNRGASWDSVYQREEEIAGIVIDRVDAAIITIATKGMRIARSFDKGQSWTTITPPTELGVAGLGVFRSMQSLARKESLFVVSSKGLWKLIDFGKTWSAIAPLTPAQSVSIRVGALNLSNENELYYATSNTFYHSLDGGARYASQLLNVGRLPSVIAIDPNNPVLIYLGLAEEEKKNYF